MLYKHYRFAGTKSGGIVAQYWSCGSRSLSALSIKIDKPRDAAKLAPDQVLWLGSRGSHPTRKWDAH